MIDVVIPNKNEEEFIKIAEKLSYKKIIFLYTTEKNIPQIKSEKIKIQFGLLTTKGGKGKYLTFMQSGENDQKIIESNSPNVLFEFEQKAEKDYIHQRASGLNNVICTFAQKNNVIISFSFKQILFGYKTKSKLNTLQQDTAKVRAQIIGRMMQNIRLCRKHKVRMAIASFATNPYEMRAPKDVQSLFELLGLHQIEAKKSFETLNF